MTIDNTPESRRNILTIVIVISLLLIFLAAAKLAFKTPTYTHPPPPQVTSTDPTVKEAGLTWGNPNGSVESPNTLDFTYISPAGVIWKASWSIATTNTPKL